jgi:hypothetical protein
MVISWTSRALTLVSTAPNAGWRVSQQTAPDEITVTFSKRGSPSSTIKISLQNGKPVQA